MWLGKMSRKPIFQCGPEVRYQEEEHKSPSTNNIKKKKKNPAPLVPTSSASILKKGDGLLEDLSEISSVTHTTSL